MSKLENTIYEIHSMDRMASEDGWLNRIHPLCKLAITIGYIIIVVSFQKYDLAGLIGMAVYPICLFIIGEISVKDCIRRLRVVLPVVCFIGIFNPLFDHTIVTRVGNLAITGGVVSMCTLIVKGILTVFATYLLIATTTIEKICYALRLIHFPKIFVTQILLIYRYVTVLLTEASHMTQAYQLRAPKQKGIVFHVWGTLVGLLLLRSMDRADTVYESMCLRGYDGGFYYGETKKISKFDLGHLIGWLTIFAVFRWVPILTIIGKIFL